MSFIIDGHLDIAMNALSYERDQCLTVAQIRQREAKLTGGEPGTCTTTVQEMRRVGVPMCVTTVIARYRPMAQPERLAPRYGLDHPTQDMAYASAMGQLAYYEALQRQGVLRILRTKQDVHEHWNDWRTESTGAPSRQGGASRRTDASGVRGTTLPGGAPAMPPLGVIITMEGADPIVEPQEIYLWHERGLRTLMLAHFGPAVHAYGTQGHNSTEDGPVTDRGIELLKEVAALKMPLDLTHLCDRSFFQAIDLFDGAIYASHSNCRALAPMQRQLSDQQIRLILERDGVIGAAMHIGMMRLKPGGNIPPRAEVGLDVIVQHLDHVCQLAGDAKHAAIGSDLDGGFGAEDCPHDLDTVADLRKLDGLLKARGYSDEDVKNILHGNWLRFWMTHLPG
ncbi:MAG: membrane dipeptidase [Phycisphaeraceae bacterium]